MRTLVIPDLHQDIPWLEAILDRELHEIDRMIFIGDYTDAFKPKYSMKRTLRALTELQERADQLNVRVDWLLGNHDAQYLYYYKWGRTPYRYAPNPLFASGYSRNQATKFIRYVDRDWANRLTVCTTVPSVYDEPWLISHAGYDSSYIKLRFDDTWSWADELERLEDEGRLAVSNIQHNPHHPLFWAGQENGGDHRVSGPLWLRWFLFKDNLPSPQIVGHTSSKSSAIRTKSRSLCIDNQQHTYLIIEDGEPIVRSPYLDDPSILYSGVSLASEETLY